MKPSSVRCPVSVSFWVLPSSVEPPLQAGFVDLSFGQAPGEYWLSQAKTLTTAKLRAPRQGAELESLLGSGRARLATVDQVSKDGSAARVTVRFFNGGVVEIGAVDIGVDDHVHEAAWRLLKTGRKTVAEIAGLLQELCTLNLGPTNDDCFFLLIAGEAASREFKGVDLSLGEEAPEGDAPAAPAERAFAIHGDGLRIAVARKHVAREEEQYLAVRLTSSLGGAPDGAVRLAHGRLTFSDFTRTGRVRALAAGAMSQLMKGENGYLKKWDEYGAIEGEMLLRRARSIGVLSWNNAEQQTGGGTGIKLFFDEPIPEGLASGDELEIAEIVPVYLQRPEMTWAEYSGLIESELETKKLVAGSTGRLPGPKRDEDDGGGTGTRAKVSNVAESSLVLDLPIPPNRADQFLILSLSGERVQIERRMEARRRILEGRSANPMLGSIIEEDGTPPEPLRPSKIKALSAFVRDKVFAHAPTGNQEEAIRIALNTPDIALIQGPPGTGKTTVIAAIVERLNELSDKGRAIQGEVLISAYQHDAIENMKARLTVNSIPVPKFGRRSGTVEIGDRNTEQIRRWCEEITARLREKNPDLEASEKLRDAQLRCHEYVLAPSLDNALATLDAFLQLPEGHLPASLVERAKEIRQRIEHERDGRLLQGDSDRLRALWSLRTSLEGFLDDGPEMAEGLLALCGPEIPAAEREVLTRAAKWLSAEPPPFLVELRQVKSALLDWYRPRAVFRLDKPRKDVLDLVDEAAQRLATSAGSGAKKTDGILVELLHELESNPTAAQRAVEDYGYVFAATCQQSKGTKITRRKARDGTPDYDTVIVDEAERVGPRDLLIPMSQARKRIILVGDHRQLPHMIDDAIARSLETRGASSGESASVQEDSHIRRSMFQYLLSRLKQLQARDGNPRWVTLNQQFRMHPSLGQFVSDHFYKVHDPDEAFSSPLPAEQFAHGLPGIPGVPAIWVDAPVALGEERRSGTSCYRPAEADLIAGWIERWIDSPAGRRLTFGVISFYKAQENEVFKALSRKGVTTQGPDGKWSIEEAYALRPAEEGLPPEERLRIGTVDAFQGMEFDVVFLSIVRAKGRLPAPSADASELADQERKQYGHLTSPNRLCVSMSRQKRLLVVVGDRAMVDHELARGAIPGLVGFLELCRTQGAVLGPGA